MFSRIQSESTEKQSQWGNADTSSSRLDIINCALNGSDRRRIQEFRNNGYKLGTQHSSQVRERSNTLVELENLMQTCRAMQHAESAQTKQAPERPAPNHHAVIEFRKPNLPPIA
jgi:hypothetical protein